jgi:hypothetical protein
MYMAFRVVIIHDLTLSVMKQCCLDTRISEERVFIRLLPRH